MDAIIFTCIYGDKFGDGIINFKNKTLQFQRKLWGKNHKNDQVKGRDSAIMLYCYAPQKLTGNKCSKIFVCSGIGTSKALKIIDKKVTWSENLMI